MEFNQLVLRKLDHIIQENNLRIAEERQNYVKLQTSYLVIVISHNPLENSNTLWLSQNDMRLNIIEIDSQILSLFFHSNLRLNDVSTETFVNNIALFFENEAKSLLHGNLNILVELEEFDQARNDHYTESLLKQQNLNAANIAWEEENYGKFIKCLDQIEKESLPVSYQLKYKIAHRKKG